jgi:hypothetical protein
MSQITQLVAEEIWSSPLAQVPRPYRNQSSDRILLAGYVGSSTHVGRVRLYLGLDLNSYYELHRADIIEIWSTDPTDPDAPQCIVIDPRTELVLVASDPGTAHSSVEPEIWEELQGFVEKIEGDKAYIHLDSQSGERLYGSYPAGELTVVGIGERDRFLLQAVEVEGAIRFEALLIPRRKINPARQREIRAKIEQVLGDFDLGIEGKTVLETFDGIVDRIEGDTAFVTLQSRANGDVEKGTYSASQLARMGIHEQSCFVFKTVDVGNAIRPVFEPVPQEPVAAEVVREIDSQIDQPLPEAPPPAPQLCEEFQGFVEKIEGDNAYVRLDSQRGDRLNGPYPAGELAAAGIGERNRFILRTVDLGRDVRIEVTPIPPVELTAEREREIEEETERLFAGFDPADDY